MIRMTLALLATLYLGFMIAGEDRGQVRYGLMAKAGETPVVAVAEPAVMVVPATNVEVVQVVPAVFIPAPTMVIAAETTPEIAPEATPAALAVVAEPPETPEPAALQFVSVSTANVREGPSKDFAVIDKLARGEAVAVISATEGPEGWSLIRIEGDGLEGYISNELLSAQP